ncbi:hypothetical protein [Sphingomonas daechungensis]|uniref:hypothetical protein n=1 Tax=Sphingomonas daechungensis TaxID=1176646 RepID=UPI0037834D0E
MPLRGLTVYGPSDASAYYTLGGGGTGDAWITFYVYPATISLAEESAGVEQSLLQILQGRRIDPPAPAPANFHMGRVAWFEGLYKNIDARTGYMLVQRGQWFLKARITVPKKGGPEAMGRALKAIAALQWDWGENKSDEQGAKVAFR